MFNGYWITFLQLLLWNIDSSIGECRGDFSVECISVKESDLMAYLTDNPKMYSLTIERSYIPHVEMFPIDNLGMLTIKKSSVEKFLPEAFEELGSLDLSFNEIRDVDFLKDQMIDNVVMHHNNIEFLNGSNVNKYIRNLDLSYNNIKNITTLEQEGLLSLNISNNKLKSIADVFNIHTLEFIDLSFNELKIIRAADTVYLENVIYFNLSHNNIESFDFEERGRSFDIGENTFLDLSFNEMKDSRGILRFSGDTLMFSSIHLESNHLDDIQFLMRRGALTYDNLIVSRNKRKELLTFRFHEDSQVKLYLSQNEIEYFFPSSFKGLEVNELRLEYNKLSSLNYSSFDGLFGLRILNLSHNPLMTIDEMVFTKMNASLISIDLSHCLLKTIPVSLFKYMKGSSEINLSHNRIEVIAPESFSRLKLLNLSNNKIKFLPANVFSHLETSILDLSFNPLKNLRNIFNNTKIENIYLEGISLQKLSDENLTGLEHNEYLDLSNTGILELNNNTFDKLFSLKELVLDQNSIKIIPSNFFGFNMQLITLSMVGNPISIISEDSFPHKMKLKYLYMTLKGEIPNLAFQNLIFLEKLHFLHSLVTKINKDSFKGLHNLRTLNFENSTVVDVVPGAFSGLSRVSNIDERNFFNNISTIKSGTFFGLKALHSLDLSSMGIEVIENGAFHGLRNLSSLTLSHNKITKLPQDCLVELGNLKILDLSYNELEERDSLLAGIFRNLTELRELHLQKNYISYFPIGMFSNLKNLRFLNLSYNHLYSLNKDAFLSLKNLEILDINSNYFRSKGSIESFPRLKKIGLGGNIWHCEDIVEVLNHLKEHNVDYREMSSLVFETRNVDGISCECDVAIRDC